MASANKKTENATDSAARIALIASHLQEPASLFKAVPQAPADAIFSILAKYNVDKYYNKTNLTVGAYRDDNGKPWVLPSVKKATEILISNPEANHEYLPMGGLQTFVTAAVKLLLGEDSIAIKEGRAVGVQALSGTGALRLGAEFLKKFYKRTVYISDPTWANHRSIMTDAGLQIASYPYWNAQEKCLDFEGIINTMKEAPNGSIFLLHACAHNPTGVDPNPAQWMKIAEVMKEKDHFPFFDCAYQGFASGDLDKDAYAVRLFVDMGFELICSQSFAKNLGLYGQRTGCITLVTSKKEYSLRCQTQLAKISRAIVSNAPRFGAEIANIVLNTPELTEEWYDNLKTMSSRIIEMRKQLHQYLVELKTPGSWDHIVDQIGMFSYTGLNVKQCRALMSKFHIYLTENGRISMAGLNSKNVKAFAEAIDYVVRNVH
ncbi:aspartate aminotransferase [Piromyces finnis]|uniref:aspartate transaminase n=1 Tax=Piromyces finnis TaxID=1754191 RepID=A0A1Y1VMC6_9FUNG|nr:aspartate aminotransferase [Piromyces finnis]|eukprot:ORX60077.1 aspartate aminotransferase [Piromyces finnis]